MFVVGTYALSECFYYATIVYWQIAKHLSIEFAWQCMPSDALHQDKYITVEGDQQFYCYYYYCAYLCLL